MFSIVFSITKKQLCKLTLAIAAGFVSIGIGAQEEPIPTLEELLAAGAAEEKQEWAKTPYSVVDGKVDLATYRGWRQYHSICHTCHGPDAIGSSFAPNLVEAFSTNPDLTYAEFIKTIYDGRQVKKEGQQAMLAFGTNRDVIRNLDNLYAYLRARADGKLEKGRPKRQPK